MKSKISFLLVLVTLILVFSGCGAPQAEKAPIAVKSGDTFYVNVSMADSGNIKSMALSLYFDDSAFELIEGEWLNHNAVITDFNKETRDAAVAFKESNNFSGEIFRFSMKAKKDLTIIDDMIMVEAVLKDEQTSVECKGIELTYTK